MAMPITYPLTTSQNAAEAKPEKIREAGAMCRIIATAQNRSAVMYSGSLPEAHNPIVTATKAATVMSCPSIPAPQLQPMRHSLKLLHDQHYRECRLLGTKRTWCDVRSESAFRG